jgi:hypothetical protein
MPFTEHRENDDSALVGTGLILALYISAAVLFLQGMI